MTRHVKLLASVFLCIFSVLLSIRPATAQECAREIAAKEFDRNLILTDESKIDRQEALTNKYQYQLGFRSLLTGNSGATYLVVDDQADDALIKSAETDGLKVIESCVSSRDLQTTLDTLTALTPDDTGDYSTIGYYVYDDVIYVTSSIPAQDVESALNRAGLTTESQAETVHFLQGKKGAFSRTSGGRAADVSPHYGASQIVKGTKVCSSAFKVINSTGDQSMMSAGHCFNLNDLIANGTGSTSGSNYFGKVVYKTFPDPDLLSISQSQYVARIYSSTDNGSNKAIFGAGDPTLQTTYCNYGNPSLRICTEYVGLSVAVDFGGVTTNLAWALSAPGCPFGPLGQSGDSGGPIGREFSTGKIGARGLTIAAENPNPDNRCTRYDHKWSTIASIFNVSIVNG